MLQNRLIYYADAQRYRLGTNHYQIPVNKAQCPVFSNHRDGQGRVDGNYGSLPHYEPNSFGQWQAQTELEEPELRISGNGKHWSFNEDESKYFEQSVTLFLIQ